jgi:hypothetical protein
MDDEGNSYTIDLPEKEDGTADLPATITDENGNVYDMDKNGALTEAKNKENISVEDKSIPEIDRNKLLWLQLQTNNDSLFNNHTLHLVQQTSSFVPVLIWVYSNKIINWMAKDLIEKHKIIGYRNLTQSDSIMWKQYNVRNTVVESETGAFFVPNIDNAGKYTLTADAQKAFNFMITYETDSIARIQRDTLLKGIDFAGDLKLKINLSVSKTGQILFKPINDNYHEHYGFDDAMKEECRQSKDFMGNSDYELLSINGIDYYAPWLGVLPNEEAEIKLEYTMPQADIDMLENDFKIVLKSSNTVQLLIDGKDKQEYDLFKTKNIKLKTESANEYEITAWLKDAAGRETMTGKLKIDCRDFKPAKKLRIIRVKRQDESSYPPPVNKTQLVNDVNKLYRQSFTQFELDNEAAYNDTLTIQKTSLDALNIEYFNTIGLKYESEIYYLYVVSSGVNVDQGEANMPHIAFSGYPENLTKTLVLFGNTDYDNAAHELGHVLGFKHTFEPYKTNEEVNYINVLTHKNRKVIDLYSTRNIMDYIYQGEPVTQRRYFFKYQIDHLK